MGKRHEEFFPEKETKIKKKMLKLTSDQRNASSNDIN